MKLPEINVKLRNKTKKVTELKFEILKIINNFCKNNNFETTYAEINNALSEIICDNTMKELKLETEVEADKEEL